MEKPSSAMRSDAVIKSGMLGENAPPAGAPCDAGAEPGPTFDAPAGC